MGSKQRSGVSSVHCKDCNNQDVQMPFTVQILTRQLWAHDPLLDCILAAIITPFISCKLLDKLHRRQWSLWSAMVTLPSVANNASPSELLTPYYPSSFTFMRHCRFCVHVTDFVTIMVIHGYLNSQGPHLLFFVHSNLQLVMNKSN